eukprot:TRINITY_DN3164_c0_g1_i1.p1 TRINITY_DN3164_c0_g1~~TRINITY_DN3164_c0_g1_i1.p1  ORF type:complete len:585 (+),score=144.75 TRINITY_DN3164_c0_g1_i1:45-1799(+)
MGSLCSADEAPKVGTDVEIAEPQKAYGNCKELNEQLTTLLVKRPYLNKEDHGLHQYVKEARAQLAAGRADDAANALVVLDLENKAEELSIATAFQKFDHSGDGVLQGDEIKFMLDYLGFPCTDEDIAALMKIVDVDSDKSLSFDEFMKYVSDLGGSGKLFELRRTQIEDRHKSSGEARFDKATLQTELAGIGISNEALAYWELTANRSELEEAAMLKACQRNAVRHIRNLAKVSHGKALPQLRERAIRLGFTEVDLHMALAWVRELAPIIIHIKLDKLGDLFAADTHYRNQFETNSSAGLLKPSARISWEAGLFGTAYQEPCPGFDRPKYGVQNIWNDHRGVLGALQYGDSYLVLKDVRLRCTMSPEDSANLPATRLAVPEYYAHVMMDYSDKELTETLRVAQGGDELIGDSKAVIEKWGKYKEVQIHGEVDFKKHVERLVVNDKHSSRNDWIEKIAKAHGWKVTWMKDMEVELKGRTGGREMDEKSWKEKLEQLEKEQASSVKASQFVEELWFFEVREGWKLYDKVNQKPLEALYQKYKASPSTATEVVEMPVRKGQVIVNFKEMWQQVKGNDRKRKIRRSVE